VQLQTFVVKDLRTELARLELGTEGLKRELVGRLLEAQASGKALSIRPKTKKKRAPPKTSSATRDVNAVPRQAGWAWIEFSDGEASWFHLRASHFGNEMNNQERRGAWRRAVATDKGIDQQWRRGDGMIPPSLVHQQKR
jgi:hypothetical protein